MTAEISDLSLTQKAVAAMRTAVNRVVEDHRRRGKPLIIWRDGKVVFQHPDLADEVREGTESYQNGQVLNKKGQL
ncbi:MAG: hypothetical protein AB7S77_23790 [Desulfatirhabdiaceae bacterium]